MRSRRRSLASPFSAVAPADCPRPRHGITSTEHLRRYRGRSKFYPGKISRDRGDGTFDIAYDDGESETRVREDLIKAADAGDDDDQRRGGRLDRDAFREGDKVEADYRGRGKFYPGKIRRDRGDDTYPRPRRNI